MSKRVLDVACGSRMFWFDREHPDVVFHDKRSETHWLKDKSSKGGRRKLEIKPDVIGDFTRLDFPDNRFDLVVFDPPHLLKSGESGWLAKKYGKLSPAWKDEIAKGFEECFRVLKPNGTLIFKWQENDISLTEILSLSPQKPLFGNRGGRTQKMHWIVFMKKRPSPARRR